MDVHVISENYDFYDEDYIIEADDEDLQEATEAQANKERPTNLKKNENDNSAAFVILNEEYVADSEYVDSDELISDDSLEDIEMRGLRRKLKDTEFNIDRDRYDPNLQLGMRFASFKEFKEAVKNWGIKHHSQPFFSTNDSKRCIAKCHTEKKSKATMKCSFFIYAVPVSRSDPTVQIKTLQLQHNCGLVFSNFHMTSDWLARRYLDRFRANPGWAEEGLMNTVAIEHRYEISRTKAWRVKRKCLNKIYGEEEKQYAKLPAYMLELKNIMPGSNVQFWRPHGLFKGFYVCLQPLKEAWKRFLRPIVCVDACHLNGNYKGQLFAAIGIDPNNCIFPIAWAVTLTEDRETWTWFLELVGYDLELFDKRDVTFMSDRQKGLIGAVKELFANAEHRNCVRHMYVNFQKSHKGKELKDLVWSAARASYLQRFNQIMEKIEVIDKDARDWFNHPDRPIESWTRAYFREGAKCDILLNNLCECFNNYILDTRKKGIVTMLEMIKNKVMKRMYTKREMANKWGNAICPKVAKILERRSMLASMYICSFSGGPQIMIDGAETTHICNMELHTCTCKRWQLTGVPCSHAVAAIMYIREGFEKFVDNYYKVDTYKNVYSFFINPTKGEEFWEKPNDFGEVIPPPRKNAGKGRPTTKRRKEAVELETEALKRKLNAALLRRESRMQGIEIQASSTMEESSMRQKLSRKGRTEISCGHCKGKGHNKRSCPLLKAINQSNSTKGSTYEWPSQEDFLGSNYRNEGMESCHFGN